MQRTHKEWFIEEVSEALRKVFDEAVGIAEDIKAKKKDIGLLQGLGLVVR